MSKSNHIPTYSLEQFNTTPNKHKPYQVEVFDANRHFEVQYPHRHDFFEVLFLTKGSGQHIIDSNSYNITPPCIFFLSPGQAHKLELSEDVEGYIFLFTAEFYLINKSNKNRLLELPFFYNIHLKNPPLNLSGNTSVHFITNLFLRGCEKMEENSSLCKEEINAILDLLLNTCHSIYPKEIHQPEKGKGHLLVKRFRQIIEEKYQENLSINQYAELLNVTPNHLTQTVKSLTGNTSNNLIKQKLILEIKRLLLHTDLSSTEISNQLNFNDQSYFTKFFKRSTGLTPKEYRVESMKNT